MSSHGPQFDDFTASPTHDHGGAEYDEFGRPSASSTKSTGLAEHFPQKKGLDAHGPQWDEFGWRTMPVGHGHSFDSNFRQEAALDGGEHGTWHDVFRGGTQVRAIAGGRDVEGTVLNAGDDHLTVKLRDGRETELGLEQLRAFRHVEAAGAPTRTGIKTATPGHTDAPIVASSAEAPSAHDATARGGGRVEIPVDTGDKFTNKTITDDDVAKTIAELRALAAE